ncbi:MULTISPECIES: hypothetical protein [Pseudidiomarina]|uniref:Uncharacterized protein n=2 Tax=Pseudidiomarina TaxID=2800384 RepID=A0A368UY09_9GAMM|nr:MULTISPECIES: hypothetical protein [Pseudidiomarina]PWW14138.1 hypothetical protein DET45_10477 [Pseudidiomarina maritima]RBP91952.1 hypothetical protein DFO81_10377 [Pseudidiomarina tainanensis]RCW33716.1 hypothetical protein DFO79_10497 [Pseudidiomarina tainanensis]
MRKLMYGFGTSALMLTTVLTAAWSAPATAQTAVDAELLRCADIKNALQRLVCFDELAAQVTVAQRGSDETAVAASAPGASGMNRSARAAERSQADVKQKFGKEHRTAIEDAPDRQYITITKLEQNARGYWVVETEDGQIWEQSESGTFLFKDNARYYIERGAFTSFFLSYEGTPRRIKVRRID